MSIYLSSTVHYLKNEPLPCVMDTTGNDWYKFLDSTPCVVNCDLILKRDQKASLKQLFERLNEELSLLKNAEEVSCLHSNKKCVIFNLFFSFLSFHLV